MSRSKRFNLSDVQILDRCTVFQGFFRMTRLRLRHRLFAGGWSATVERELFEREPCVGVLLYDPRLERVALTEQFRVGVLDGEPSPWLFEVVAGIAEEGETLRESARREVREEAGLDVSELVDICDYWVSPGGTNERMYLFCGIVDLEGAGGLFGVDHEAEDIRLHVLPEQQAYDWLDEGRCNNAATTISLMWLRLNRQRFL